jgi:hypothetical protein
MLVVQAGAHAEEVSSWTQIESLVESGRVSSIDQLLPHLSPELRSSFLLAYQSRSTISASLTQPRVVLYSKSSNLVLAFTSSPDVKDGNRLEVIERNPSDGELVFRKIEFPRDGHSKPSIVARPKECMGCHQGAQGRMLYNWDEYPDWPGFFGNKHRKAARFGQGDGASMLPDFDFQRDGLAALQSTSNKTAPRLKFLPGFEETTPEKLGERNTYFTEDIVHNEYQALARAIERSPQYRELLPAILGSEDEDISKLLPPELREQYKAEIPKIRQADEEASHRVLNDKVSRFHSELTKYGTSASDVKWSTELKPIGLVDVLRGKDGVFPSTRNLASFSNLQFVLRKMGIDISDYSSLRNREFLLLSPATPNGSKFVRPLALQLDRDKIIAEFPEFKGSLKKVLEPYNGFEQGTRRSLLKKVVNSKKPGFGVCLLRSIREQIYK